MVITYEKEKARNAIKFFTENTATCEKKKLFKLLFFLDFEHFAETGRPVTGYQYNAWERGPVPVGLFFEIKNQDPELLQEFELNQGPSSFDSTYLESKTPFDEKYFTKREMRIMRDIANRFMDKTGAEMEDFTHWKDTPWDRVYNQENRKNQRIPFEYQLNRMSEEDKAFVLEMAADNRSFIEAFK